MEKLAPVYRDLPIPLFDGYDLDTEPEDPARYYADLDVPASIEMVPSSPRAYVDAVSPFMADAPCSQVGRRGGPARLGFVLHR